MSNNVVETRVLLSMKDQMSRDLLKAQKNLNSFNKSGQQGQSVFKGLTGSLLALGGAYEALNTLKSLAVVPIEFAKNMETNKIGIAGIMQSMLTVNGENIKWNQSLQLSADIMTQLNQKALETAATSEELIDSFRALLGPGLASGMSMDELIEFTTVGTNAVKSLGLQSNQVIQELRDLVQGGITASSSTLASALQLKDADIKAAKESSEGLFRFLMKRMEGFQYAARETPKTFAGALDQVKEGYTRTMAEAIQKPMESFSANVLAKISNIFLDEKSFALNQKTLNAVKSFGDHLTNAGEGAVELAAGVGKVLSPALEVGSSAMGLMADNTKAVGVAFGAWKLGTVLAQSKDFFSQYSIMGKQAADEEMRLALKSAQAISIKENQRLQQLKQRQEIEKITNQLTKDGNDQLAKQINGLAERYQKLGTSAKDAQKLQLQAAKLAKQGNKELCDQLIKEQELHLQNAQAVQKHANSLQKMQRGLLGLGGTLGTVSGSMLLLSDNTDDWLYKVGNTGFFISSGIGAIGLLIDQLENLRKAYQAVKLEGAAAGLLTAGGIAGAAAVGIGTAVGGTAAFIYAKTHGISLEEAKKRYFNNPNAKKEMDDLNAGQAVNANKVDTSSLGLKDFGDRAGAPAGKVDSSADKALRHLTKMEGKVSSLIGELGAKSTEYLGSSLEIANSKLHAELEKIKATLNEAKLAGVSSEELAKAKTEMEKYQQLAQAQNERDYLTASHDMTMERLQTLEDTYAVHYSVIDNLRAEELRRYQQKLQEELTNVNLNEQEKLRLRKEYADATVQLNEATAGNLNSAWAQSLDYMRNMQFNFADDLKGGFDSIVGEFTNFGQNMLTEQKSFSTMSKNLFKSMANDIMNTMMKVIMKGLVMNGIMSMLGLGGGTIGAGSSPEPTFSIGGMTLSGNNLQGYANGGMANGWAVVGEKGPELVNFSSPGRVYNNAQTKAALSGISSMKVEIINQSGTPLQAETAEVRFDGEKYVLSTVIKAIANNTGGFRNLIKGVAR